MLGNTRRPKQDFPAITANVTGVVLDGRFAVGRDAVVNPNTVGAAAGRTLGSFLTLK